jgi:hypothetical protein
MKQKIKKYIYLINDVSNLLLKKERVQTEENAQKLRTALIIVSVVLFLSLAFNFYLFLR